MSFDKICKAFGILLGILFLCFSQQIIAYIGESLKAASYFLKESNQKEQKYENIYANIDLFTKSVNTRLKRALDKEMNCQIHRNKENTTCSLDTLRTHLDACGYFSTAGNHWTKDLSTYRLHICNLASPESTEIHRYIVDNNITRILLLGDSHGRRFTLALINIINRAGYKCRIIKQERNSYNPGVGYFLQGSDINTQALFSSKRTCHTCMSTLRTCSHSSGGAGLEVEYVSMTLTHANSVIANMTYCASNYKDPICQIKTQHEFLFEIYLRKRYPDLLLMFTTFGHSTAIPIDEIYDGMDRIINVMKNAIPKTTKQIFFTSMEQKLVSDSSQYDGMWSINGKIIASNWVLYDVLSKFGHENMFGFFDLSSMATSVPKWYIDKTHMIPRWYRTVISMVFSVLAAPSDQH